MLADSTQCLKQEDMPLRSRIRSDGIELLVVDEVDCLPLLSLEVLRDLVDRSHLGLMLLVRPGGLNRLLHLQPLAGRVGILHEFDAMSKGATRQLLEEQVQQWGLTVDRKGVEIFVERTRGNFGTISNVLMHLSYLVERRNLVTLTDEVVELAISRLLKKRTVEEMQKRLRGIEPM